jgi:hypothetical protein
LVAGEHFQLRLNKNMPEWISDMTEIKS